MTLLKDAHTHVNPHAHSIYVLSLSELLSKQVPVSPFIVGIHPWWLSEEIDQEKLKIHILSLTTHPYFVGLGETGLDRIHRDTWEEQLRSFEWHRELAYTIRRPLILHCVRAYADFLAQLKSPTSAPWIFHDYRGDEQTTKRLLDFPTEIYFSFGESLLHSEKVQSLLKAIPQDRLLLETDDSQVSLHNIYGKVSELLLIHEDSVKHQITLNWQKAFNLT